jgi:hypothetical protein
VENPFETCAEDDCQQVTVNSHVVKVAGVMTLFEREWPSD